MSFFTRTSPELLDRLELHKGEKPLFEKHGIEEAIKATLSRRVDLPSGGYLMIDYAEAMTVIDVNSGSFTGRGKGARLEDTITRTNLEAAEEVVRQLRLRDIGGIIVIDFIDMSRARNRDAVLKILRKELDEDRTKTYVMEISPLGLVEMTRQNVTDGVREILTKTVPDLRRARASCCPRRPSRSRPSASCATWSRSSRSPRPILIQVHPRVSSQLLGAEAGRPLLELEQEVGKHFHFEGSEALPLDWFELVRRRLARRDRAACAALPRGRGAARPDRGAAHVRRGRGGRQDRLVRDLGRREPGA